MSFSQQPHEDDYVTVSVNRTGDELHVRYRPTMAPTLQGSMSPSFDGAPGDPVEHPVWSALHPQLLESCGVALRRMPSTHSSIAVTSTTAREGRTSVALGLAAASSKFLRRRTILVDLDPPGAICGQLDVSGVPGLWDVLSSGAELDACVQRVTPTVEVVSAGTAGSISELLGATGQLEAILHRLRSRCDLLIADLPPLAEGIATVQATDLFECVALVVRAGKVSVDAIESAASTLSERPYVILNGAGPRRSLVRRILGR